MRGGAPGLMRGNGMNTGNMPAAMPNMPAMNMMSMMAGMTNQFPGNMPFGGRGGGMIPQGPRGGMMNGNFGGRGGGMMGGMGKCYLIFVLPNLSSRIFFVVGMGMVPTGPMGGRGGFGGQTGGGHFNPAFMQNQNAGQFGPDGPRKRFRMEQSG